VNELRGGRIYPLAYKAIGQKRILVVDDEAVLRELLAILWLVRVTRSIPPAMVSRRSTGLTNITTMPSSSTFICRGWM